MAEELGSLAHHGTKGMRWGVRNDRGHEGEVVKTKQLGKLDKKWEKEHTGVSGFIKAHNAAADRMNNGEIDRINNKPEYKKAADEGVFMNDNHPTTQKYLQEYDETFNRVMNEEVLKFGMNPSGTKQYELVTSKADDGSEVSQALLVPVDRKVKHADDDAEFVPPTYRLKRNAKGLIVDISEEKPDVKHAGEEFVGQFLSHVGVKGMKWGVHKNDSGGGDRGKIRRGLTKLNVATTAGHDVIKEGEAKLIFLPLKNRRDAASETQLQVIGEAVALNRKPQFKGKDLKKDPELKKAYYDQIAERAKTTYANELQISRVEAWGELLNVNTDSAATRMRIEAASERLRHADDDDKNVLLELNFKLDDLGHIVDVKINDKYLQHDETDDVYLEHHGVKGMKWGVSRRNKDTSPTDVSVDTTPSGKIKTSGGKNQGAHEDAIRAAAARQKAKASSTNSLSNKELQDAVSRMNLENQYARLSQDRQGAGKKFIRGLLGDVGKGAVGARVEVLSDTDPKLDVVSDALRKNLGLNPISSKERAKRRSGDTSD